MRNTTLLACGLVLAAMSSADAQCNRGGGRGGGSPSANFSPITSTGFNSPLATFNSLNASPNATFLAAQYRSQLAQQRNLLAQQRRNMQLMARRQQVLERQLRQRQTSDPSSSAEQLASRSVNTTKERLRQQNAEKAFQLATRAESSGRTSKAESQYRRVIRIVGADSELGSRASDALAALADDVGGDDIGQTMLVAANTR